MEEIELKYVPEPEPAKDEYKIVNTETTCFLCLGKYNYNNPNNHDNSLPSDLHEDKVSLFRVCRYLKGDCPSISSGSPNLLSLPIGQNVSSAINLCPKCKPVTENLSDLLQQLELLKMKVDYSLCQFLKLLNESKEDGNISEKLRAEIIKKCNKKLTTVTPKVAVEDIQENQTPTQTISQVKPSASYPSAVKILPVPIPNFKNKSNRLKCNQCPKTFLHKRHLHTHRTQTHGEATQYTCQRCYSKFTKRSDYVQHKNFDCPRLPPEISKTNPPPGHRTCPNCNPSQIVNTKYWRRHNIRFHIETFFSTNRLPDWSPEFFKIYCEHVLTMQQLSAKRSRNSNNVIVCKCPYCPDAFNEQYLLRCHLVNGHKNIVTQLLIATQQQLTLEQVKSGANLPTISYTISPQNDNAATAKFGNSGAEVFTCTLCNPNQRLKVWSKSRHNANLHAEIIFSSARNPNIPVLDFKHYCEYLFEVEIESFRIVPNGTHVNGKPMVECGHCLKKFLETRSIRSHLTQAHKGILKEKLEKLQKNCEPGRDFRKSKSSNESPKTDV